MKRIWDALKRCVCLGLCTVLLAGCAAYRTGSATEEPAAAADPLTGLENLWPGQRPVAVSIDNSTGVAAQWGLSSASVVLEARTRLQGSTRLCLVYPSAQAVPQVGPIAEGEDLYWRLLVGQQVLPVQRGGGSFDQNYLDYYSVRVIDALETGRTAFSCAEEWDNAPLWYTSGSALLRAAETLGVSTALTESRLTTPVSGSETETVLAVPSLLPLTQQGRYPEATAQDAQDIRIHFDDQNATGFAYDAASGCYQMLRADGSPQLDANNGQQAAFDNLLILFSASSVRDDGQTLDYDLSMGGGVWLRGGQLWYLTWTQGTDATFAFYAADGQLLTLEAGNSYLALVSSVTGQELSVRNTAGEELFH